VINEGALESWIADPPRGHRDVARGTGEDCLGIVERRPAPPPLDQSWISGTDQRAFAGVDEDDPATAPDAAVAVVEAADGGVVLV
jgi:hypothetical protein